MRARTVSFGAVALVAAASVLGAPEASAQRGRAPASSAPALPAGDRGAAPPIERGEELNLAVGENKTIAASDVKNYSEGAPGVADVRLSTDGSQFVIVGTKPGSTTLLLIKKDGTTLTVAINVFSKSPAAVEREIQQLLEGTGGVRVRRVGARFFIEGGVTSEPDVKRIQQIASLYPGQVESLVVLGAPAAERKFNVRVDFFFVQYDRTSSYAVGINWPGRIGGAGVVTSQLSYDFVAGTTTTAQASIVNQPLPSLDIASRNGWAKVLKQSTVITTNGSEATFESGGEQNFPVTSGLVAAIQKISFGTNVTVLPRYDSGSNDLEVKVQADVSDLVPSQASTLPGRDTSKLSTLVHLKLGQSIILSGIRTRSQRRDVGGLPFLSEIPILGMLFGSHGDAKQELEGAIFIIPSVVESVPKSNADLIKSARSQYEEFSGNVELVNAYNKQPPASSSTPP